MVQWWNGTNTNGEYAKKITIHMYHIWAVHRVTRVRIHLSFKTIRIFDITVQQYLITCNFPNQIRQFWLGKLHVINQILASDHHCLYMLWAILSLVLDHLFQYQQCWQCFRTDNHRSNSIAGWCILHSHQMCPSYACRLVGTRPLSKPMLWSC